MPHANAVLQLVAFRDLAHHAGPESEHTHRYFLSFPGADRPRPTVISSATISFADLPGDSRRRPPSEAPFTAGVAMPIVKHFSRSPLAHSLPAITKLPHTRPLEAFHTLLGREHLPKSFVACGQIVALFLDSFSRACTGSRTSV